MPRHLFAEWSQVARRIARADSLALFTDFDGTIVPIRQRPDDVRLSSPLRSLLALVAANGHVVGVVSGRTLRDLDRHVRVSGIWYVGVHGFYLRTPSGHTSTRLRAGPRRLLARVTARLQRELADLPGIAVEAKRAAVAVHYRLARETRRRKARQVVEDTVLDTPSLRVLEGHKVWEILPAGPVDKAAAVAWILRREWRRTRTRRRLAIYLGDDRTDESVFRGWHGLAIAVGPRRQTAARYSLRSPAEVRVFLDRLVGMCKCDARQNSHH